VRPVLGNGTYLRMRHVFEKGNTYSERNASIRDGNTFSKAGIREGNTYSKREAGIREREHVFGERCRYS